MIDIAGWDIGGANVKAAWLSYERGKILAAKATSRSYEIWKEKDRLPVVLREVWEALDTASPTQAMAVTMTAELSDIFETKREGVLFVLDRFLAAFPHPPAHALSLSGHFIPLVEAMKRPLDFAAANWLATALWIARSVRDCLVIDVGSTTTDILPILEGELCASGRTDLERLISGELVYTGILRTNLAAIVHSTPVRGSISRVASEYFAISGDVHLILGHITPDEYSCPTPDGRPASIGSARRRVARLVCADAEMLGADEIDEISRYVDAQQIRQISQAVLQVLSRLPSRRDLPVVALGSGRSLAVRSARQLGLEVREIPDLVDEKISAAAPCVAAACLLAEQMEGKYGRLESGY